MNIRALLGGLKDPETCAGTLWKRVPRYIRQTFCAAVVLGLAAHLYVFANKFTNHDDVNSLFGNTYGAASGRWLRPFAIRLGGSASMPWLVGLLSLLCLALAACLTVSLLRIRRPLGCCITAALLVSFPTVMSTFTYLYTAFAYFLSLLLAVFGAWSALRWGWRGSALGAVAIALSLSIYQAYFPAAAALMVGALLLETLDGEQSFRNLFCRGLRLLLTLIVGLVLYMISVRVTTGGELVDYMGLQNMGKLSLKELPGQLAMAYEKYYLFFWKNEYNWQFGALKYALLLSALGTAALLCAVLWKRRLGWTRTALAAALALVFPLAADLIYIMVTGAEIHTLMLYGLCYALILPVAVAEYAAPVLREGGAGALRAAVSWVVLLTMALTAYSYTVTDNKAYLKLDLAIRQCEAYSNRLLERVESCPDYEPWMALMLVGSDTRDTNLALMKEVKLTSAGLVDLRAMRASYTYGYFLRNFLGYTGLVYPGESAEARELAETEEVREMPVYPLEGSVKRVHYDTADVDVIVVKLSQTP